VRHWTQDVPHGAGIVTLAAGVAGVIGGRGWPGLALAAVGALLLGLLRALETRDEHSAGKAALSKCEALEARLDAVEAVAEEGKKVALGASLQASARNVGRAPTF
jgi:hypothetical protein